MPFRGPVIEIPIGFGGYNANQKNISQVQIDELIDADNIPLSLVLSRKKVVRLCIIQPLSLVFQSSEDMIGFLNLDTTQG